MTSVTHVTRYILYNLKVSRHLLNLSWKEVSYLRQERGHSLYYLRSKDLPNHMQLKSSSCDDPLLPYFT